jgi:hypothetical protein
MILSIAIGIIAAAVVTSAVAAFSRAPTRCRCPECGSATSVVLLPPVLRRNEFVHLRWCTACQWEGLGRNGPEWVEGHQVAHDSGFHWGEKGFEADFGFRFRRQQPPEPAPPHHVSGFRFANDPVPTAPPQHPSGFRFGPDPGPQHRPVFRWAAEATADGFRFKAPSPSKSTRPDGGFRWKGVA